MKHATGFLKLVETVMTHVREITAEEVSALLETEQPLTLIDVREESEWAGGHITGAEHLSRGIIERDIEKRVPDKSAPIVLYCGGGYRSALAADNLQKMGYTNVLSMAGGWSGWCQKNLPRS